MTKTNPVIIIKASKMHFLLLFWVFLLFTGSVTAQTNWDDLIKKENGVIREQSQSIDININDAGKLEITAHVYEETQHFTDNAKMYSEQSIGYSHTFTEIEDIEAYSLIPSGKNKFKKLEVSDFVTSDSRSSGVFYDDQKKISYIFPGLQSGSKTILSYSKKYKEPRLWGYFMFSSFLPVERSEFTVKAPKNVKLNFHKYGIGDDEVKFTTESKGKYNVYTWTADHVNRIELSKGAAGILHSAPHLIIYVESYEFDGKEHHILGDVDDLYSWYQNFIEGIDDENNEELQVMVDDIIQGKITELEKVEAIYDWVQQNIKYIAIEDGLGGFRPRSSNTVFTRRYGDCKDMSNLIHNMLGIAQIPSNLAWIGTTAIPYSHSEVPTPMADNHMICTYVHNNQYYFLDATDQYNTLGTPTSHIQGREALIEKGSTNFELVNVPVVPSAKNMVKDSVFVTIDKNKVVGSGKVIYSGYKRIPVEYNLENLNEDDKKTFLSALLAKGNNKFMLDSVRTGDFGSNDENLQIDYDFTIDNYIMISSDDIFVNPHLKKELAGEMIDIDATPKDIFYSYKRLSSDIFCIEIPESYKVSFLPENAQYIDPDFGFTLDYEIKDNQVIIRQQIEINTLQLKINQFDSWNKMVKGLFSAYKESIVLSRI